eukprot:CAMPEP_0117426348 /NCGR_PEP_ID=MMETSP0758-20121206/6496_1 /TAXON_ID=63605 /ORGANISM="Percolomonas cosmopolitus, Strain AE-1 (ATCC 50343)" /LENGTH=183 /DNA_ID=CAMNT_0005211495 /DNA_START=197 /DNA_END=744 /DNA_ORIENTATION=+
MGNMSSYFQGVKDRYEHPHLFDDEFNEYVGRDYEWRYEHKHTKDAPRRIRKNPEVPKVDRYDENNLLGHWEYRNWFVKEWNVYLGMITYKRLLLDECAKKNGILSDKKCAQQRKEYMTLVDPRNMRRAREILWNGVKLVPNLPEAPYDSDEFQSYVKDHAASFDYQKLFFLIDQRDQENDDYV